LLLLSDFYNPHIPSAILRVHGSPPHLHACVIVSLEHPLTFPVSLHAGLKTRLLSFACSRYLVDNYTNRVVFLALVLNKARVRVLQSIANEFDLPMARAYACWSMPGVFDLVGIDSYETETKKNVHSCGSWTERRGQRQGKLSRKRKTQKRKSAGDSSNMH
jgi:hypothetical protein